MESLPGCAGSWLRGRAVVCLLLGLPGGSRDWDLMWGEGGASLKWVQSYFGPKFTGSCSLFQVREKTGGILGS